MDRLLTTEGREGERRQEGSTSEVVKGSVATILVRRGGISSKRYVPFRWLWLLSVISNQLYSDLPLSMGGSRPAGLGAQVRVGALGECGTGWGHTVGRDSQADECSDI